MGGKRFFKRTAAVFLTAATLLTQSQFASIGSITVSAAPTNLLTNGTFESDTSGWTFGPESYTYTYSVKTAGTDAGMTNNTTGYINIWAENAQDFSISQTVSGLSAGSYTVSMQADGAAMGDTVLNLFAGEKTTAISTTQWNVWDTYSISDIVVAEGGSLTVGISGSLASNYWMDIDDFTLIRTGDAPETTPGETTPGETTPGETTPGETVPAYTLDDLTSLIASVPFDYQTAGFTAESTDCVTTAVSAAQAVVDNGARTDDDIAQAYTALESALGNLIFDADIFVTKIDNYDADNSIRGVDVSSYISLMDSFDELNASITDDTAKLGFRDASGNLLDRQGFFDLLAASGINYIRTRVWNDPYNSDHKGYGGGNNDLAKAVEIGRYATNAGMKNLIDFHFSDFWADPDKQKAPKAWENFSIAEKKDAITTFVTESLTTLDSNGVDIGMVQIGNETNGQFCGTDVWSEMNILFDAGCDAVHNFDENILAVLHFTNPETSGRQLGYAKNLADYDGDNDGIAEGVSYDVFATSYYPYWHGTLSNLKSVLGSIASTYNKYVMVAETSWATTLEDGDGHANTVRNGNNDTDNDYSFTVQGQANEIRSVLNTVNEIQATVTKANGTTAKAALGVFYWEPAWIPVQNISNKTSEEVEIILEQNKLLWETYGSGWAASHASEYDPDDAGEWFGGSAVDNQAFFDFDGTPLASLNVFKYVTYGATTELAVESYLTPSIDVEFSDTLDDKLPATVTVLYNNGTSETLAASWDSDDIAAVNRALTSITNLENVYTVHGIVSIGNISESTPGETVVTPGETTPSTQQITVTCSVTIKPKNLLADSGFEDGGSSWRQTGTGCAVTEDDPYSGSNSYHFWSDADFGFTISQTITVAENGNYGAYLYIQGGDSNDDADIYLTVSSSSGYTFRSSNISLSGWRNWQLPTIHAIPANAGDTLTLTLHCDNLPAGAWGTIDDAALYLEGEKTETSFVTATALTYDGTPKEPAISHVIYDGNELTSDDYAVSYSNNTNAGTATAVVSGLGDYSFTISKDFVIAPFSLENAVITLSQNSYTYDGTAKKPSVTVTANGTVLDSSDYTVSYSSNTNAGTAFVAVNAASSNYTKSKTVSFTIQKAAGASVSFAKTIYTYTGSAITPTPVVVLNGKTLSSSEYTISYKNNINAGTATATVTLKNPNYNGPVTASFQIAKADKSIRVTSSFTKAQGSKAFSLGAKTVAGEKLTYSSSNKNVATVSSTGKITVKGIGVALITVKSAASANYNAAKSKSVTITITPKKVSISSASSKKAGQLAVKWKRASGVSGYKILYSTNRNFKNAKSYTVASGKTVSKTITKKLVKGKKYYVKVCAYKTVKVNKKTQKLYGPYSSVKQVTIRRK